MKVLRRKNDMGTIRTIKNDNKTKTYGIMGTVEDMITMNIIIHCDTPHDWWTFIDMTGKATFFQDKDTLRTYIEESFEIERGKENDSKRFKKTVSII